MQEQEIEMQVGETVQVGDYLVTVIDIDGDEVSVRIDAVLELAEVHVTNGIVSLDG